MKTPRRLVFGPVPSRRLGRSLGVDLVPFKTCSFDCIYCQLGRTTRLTTKRQAWVPVAAVLEQLKPKLASQPDYISLSGSGEPTLHSHLGEIIEGIRALTTIPVAVFTNGSLLWRKEVREAVARADVVLPSLDAPDAARFQWINRPHPEITFARLLDGLAALRREFTGAYWLEIMMLGGYTSLPPQMKELAAHIRRLRPDKVQLNTAVRPPAEEFALAVPPDRLTALARAFTPPAEVIADYRGRETHVAAAAASAESLLALLDRRPCTAADVAQGLSISPAEAVKHLAAQEAAGRVCRERRGAAIFYRTCNTTTRTAAGQAGGKRSRARRAARP